MSDPFHIFRIEVTVAACIVTPDNQVLGRNVVDGTVAFGWRAAPPPDDVSDEQVNAALAHQMSPVLAVIQTALTSVGYITLGQVDEPMTEHSKATGELGKTSPVRVQLVMSDSKAGRA